jgi:hypothetical protein
MVSRAMGKMVSRAMATIRPEDGHAAVDHPLRGEDAGVGDAKIRVHGSIVPQNGAILREAAR